MAGKLFWQFRISGLLMLVVLLCSPSAVQAQQGTQRLILKDGTYQLVTSYKIIGDRVQYRSAERAGAIEEIPLSLVDLAATEKWKKEHVAGENPALEDAKKVDEEAAAERAEEGSRMPEVAAGLRLPDNDGVWGLDVFEGTSEIVPVEQNSGELNEDRAHNMLRASINPLSGQKKPIILPGTAAKVNFHVDNPVLYIALEGNDEKEEADPGAFRVETHGDIKAATGGGSPKSHYVIVRVEPKRTTRLVAAYHVGGTGKVSPQENAIDADTQILPGGHWMKVTPRQRLPIGQYALMEVVSANEINMDVWDFGVDPQAPENKMARQPVKLQPKNNQERRKEPAPVPELQERPPE